LLQVDSKIAYAYGFCELSGLEDELKGLNEKLELIMKRLDCARAVPAMIKGIIGAFFSPEAAKDMAKSVAEFRKTLIE
jgi:hypothetical protein